MGKLMGKAVIDWFIVHPQGHLRQQRDQAVADTGLQPTVSKVNGSVAPSCGSS